MHQFNENDHPRNPTGEFQNKPGSDDSSGVSLAGGLDGPTGFRESLSRARNLAQEVSEIPVVDRGKFLRDNGAVYKPKNDSFQLGETTVSLGHDNTVAVRCWSGNAYGETTFQKGKEEYAAIGAASPDEDALVPKMSASLTSDGGFGFREQDGSNFHDNGSLQQSFVGRRFITRQAGDYYLGTPMNGPKIDQEYVDENYPESAFSSLYPLEEKIARYRSLLS